MSVELQHRGELIREIIRNAEPGFHLENILSTSFLILTHETYNSLLYTAYSQYNPTYPEQEELHKVIGRLLAISRLDSLLKSIQIRYTLNQIKNVELENSPLRSSNAR